MKELPPSPGSVKNLDFPQIPSLRLENGTELICVSDGYLPRVSLYLGIPTGRMHDPEGKRGLSQLMADMLKEGTANRSSRQFAAEMDKYAIDYSCRVYLEYTLIQFKFLENFTREALGLFSDIIYNAIFPEEEWKKAAVRWKGHLAAQMSNPSFLAREKMYKELFPESPLANSSVDPATIDILDMEDFRGFYRERILPSAGVVGFSGPLSAGDAAGLAGNALRRTGEGTLREVDVPEVKPLKRRICLVHRAGSRQSKIMVGMHAPSRKSGLNIPLKLLNQVYGGGGSSRIFMNLREDKGYTYGAYSYFRQSNYAGTFMVSTSVNNDVTAASVREIFSEMDRLKQEKVTCEELDRCKAEINGAFLRQMETPSSICSMEITRRLAGMPEKYYRDFIPELMAVEPAQIQKSAESVLNPDQAVVVIVGDRESIGSDLAELE